MYYMTLPETIMEAEQPHESALKEKKGAAVPLI